MDWRTQLSVQRWIVAVRRAHRDEPAGPRKEFLRRMLVELLIRIQ
jgi:hypothetical protein